MDVPEREVLRYLGYKGAKAGGRIRALIEDLAGELGVCAPPKSVYGIWDCDIEPPVVLLGGTAIRSVSLSGHLAGAPRAALLAATLGAGADALIRRYSVRDMEKAAVADAVCAVMIEAYCDRVTREIERETEAGYATARFSPGYGDFDIACQKDILRMLDGGRRIGLAMTDGGMLTPAKSVIAVIGFKQEKEGGRGKCGRCAGGECACREDQK
jgi:hypothetical protein